MQILLYKLRKEHGLSQREMAKLINKSEVTYRNKELGKTAFTQSEMFIIARHFNKELGDIFTPWTSRNVKSKKREFMNELKIRKDGVYLNNQKLKGVQSIKSKSTAESNHATVYLKFTAKLIWNDVGNNLWWNIFQNIQWKRADTFGNFLCFIPVIILTYIINETMTIRW